ncbi:unnamed protein product [Linum trigynum]|uniref:Uncharacterized protein n=1 Tax=Linum trigynum TaxID=586398 RepID=A0AAV2E2F0_9ROSI
MSGRKLRATLSVEELPPKAFRMKNEPQWRGGFSLGVDLGLSRTTSKGGRGEVAAAERRGWLACATPPSPPPAPFISDMKGEGRADGFSVCIVFCGYSG